MKDLATALKLLVIALVAAVALALVLTGRAAVQARAEYQMQLAPRTLHQMVIESETAGRPDRSNTLLHGAGLLALAGLAFGALVVGMNGGRDFLREVRLGRKKKKARRAAAPYPYPHSPYPTVTDGSPAVAPTARLAPLLGGGRADDPRPRLGDGHPYDDHPGER